MTVIRRSDGKRGPSLKARLKKKGRGKRDKPVVKQKDPAIPHHSRRPLPEPGPCVLATCEEGYCAQHCKIMPGLHEIDWNFSGWAKGHGDGTFDLSCKKCGAIGRVKVRVKDKEVVWV